MLQQSRDQQRNVRLEKLFADAMLDAMLKSCCQKKMVTPAVMHEAGDIKLLTHRGQASGRTPGPFIWLPGACIYKDRKALDHSLARLSHSFRLIVMVTTKSAFVLPNGWVFQIQNAWFAEHPRKRSDGGSTAPAVDGGT
jgi:hypothetical protein